MLRFIFVASIGHNYKSRLLFPVGGNNGYDVVLELLQKPQVSLRIRQCTAIPDNVVAVSTANAVYHTLLI